VHSSATSYGGGVALRAAVERPDRIASLTSTSQRPSTSSGRSALVRWRPCGNLGLAARTAEGVITGNYRGAAASFVDYGAARRMGALRPSVQAALIRAGCPRHRSIFGH
jgi:pimeloyl-ACP methyl ester carboxylesterase